MKILMVLTSHADLGDTGNKTGVWLEEFASPYYSFVDAGADITLASPKGGKPPVDPGSLQEQFLSDSTRRFDGDSAAQTLFDTTKTLDAVSAEGFDGIFYPGGHGPLWDLANDEQSLALISSFHAAGKPVGAVCHGTAALLKATDDSGKSLIAGMEITAFTDSEEEAVGATAVVPLSVEQVAVKLGAKFRKADNWSSFAIADGLLITGQNPQSSEATAKLMLEKLQA
ncbi:MAG: type 1 glutamine amidotransferase domain-containing protein [Sneathiella sp.]|nr:type 1 glutamine amidotransferase domain-containing protein [Sneathiella sp.]